MHRSPSAPEKRVLAASARPTTPHNPLCHAGFLQEKEPNTYAFHAAPGPATPAAAAPTPRAAAARASVRHQPHSPRQPRVRGGVLTRRRPRRHARQRAAKLFVAKAAALDSYEVVGALLVAHANAKKAATPRKLEALLQKNELSLAAARALEALAEAAVGPQAVRANGVGYSLAAATRGPGGLFALARRYLCGKKQFSLYLDFVEAFAPAHLVRRTRRRPSFYAFDATAARRRRPTHRVRAQARASPTAAVLLERSRRSPRTRRPS